LAIALFIRYGDSLSWYIVSDHVLPFSVLFVLWCVVFFVYGLYEKRSVILRNSLFSTLIQSQIWNALIAVVFFYFIPFVGIAPKTNLFLHIVISSLIIFWWRSRGYYFFGSKKREEAFLIAGGSDAEELKREVNASENYNIRFVSSVDVNGLEQLDFQGEILKKIYADEISVIVVDLHNPKVEKILPSLYNLIFSQVRFIDMNKVYEDIFDRVPLSLIKENWFLENISTAPKFVYDSMKRVMDILIAGLLGVVVIPFFPFVVLAIKIEDGGDAFISQKRIGKNNSLINIFKFRSMNISDGGKWVSDGDNRITKVGSFLRKSRIDELPQLWNVIKGDMSLIGPRPDIYDLGMKLSKEIPYYTIRSIIKPGLSGWAQIRQDLPPQSLEETKMRLSYDFYYIKNRSFLLDLKIALKTIKTLLSRMGI
jgi:exopolysaccharide biosynthesis polyprenyl glycosylphosphotransferase